MGPGPRRGGGSGRETLHSELGWGAGEVLPPGQVLGLRCLLPWRPVECPERVSGWDVSATSGRPGFSARAAPGPWSSAESACRFPGRGELETSQAQQGLPLGSIRRQNEVLSFVLTYLPLSNSDSRSAVYLHT